MGQAKLRGSFEQRQAEGIARRERERLELEELRKQRLEAYKRRVAALPPAQRQATKRALTMLSVAAMGAMVVGAGPIADTYNFPDEEQS
jgi:hypothetical protein